MEDEVITQPEQIEEREPVKQAPPPVLAEAASFADHKKIRNKEEGAATIQPSEPKGESAEPSEGSQQQEKPKRDRSAEGRAKELFAAGRIDEGMKILREAERKKITEELQISGTRKPEVALPTSQPVAKEQPQNGEFRPKPKLADFVAKATTYEEAQELWEDSVSDWRDEKRQHEAEKARQAQFRKETETSIQKRIEAAKSKYSDWDAVTAADTDKRTGLILPPAVLQYVAEEEDGMDVAYYLGKNPGELQRIHSLSPARQIVEVGKIADQLADAETPVQTLKPAISKAPPPPRVISGGGPPPKKSLAEAGSLEEHKRLRAAGVK